ncbi:MAG: ChpI protein [Chloroflexi bacterium]|jgi:aspartokinase-like uncharacterized kinase|nr:ChpI protein [Chloroflexota bacterium]
MYSEITIPQPISEAAERLAHTMGISLSELYAEAISDYVMSHQKDSVTELLNQVYKTESSALEPELIRLQLASVDSETW